MTNLIRLTDNASYVLQTIDISPQSVCNQDLIAITGQDKESRDCVTSGLCELLDKELVSRGSDPDLSFDRQNLYITPAGQRFLQEDDARLHGLHKMVPLSHLIASSFADELLRDGVDPDNFKAMLKGEIG